MKISLVVFLLCVTINLPINCQNFDEDLISACMGQSTCGSCVAFSPKCRWCSDIGYHGNYSTGCNTYESLISNGCPKNAIQERKNVFVSVLQKNDTSDVTATNLRPIQLKPQRIQMGLSPDKTVSVDIEFRPAKDYPLDLYFLMDLSISMKDDKDTLSGLGSDLAMALKNLTHNYRLGFGSFAEKPLMPYVKMNDRHRSNPCTSENEVCDPTYIFHHSISMTENVDDFIQAVNNSQVTANMDNTEAGMEALMQVLVCENSIGWNQKARKFILVATDGMSHFAGDGLLGGATKPNDKKCHLKPDGNYDEGTMMDYPSFEQIHGVITEQKAKIIFAVTQEVQPYYNELQKLYPKSIFVSNLSNNSSNILNLIKMAYESFTSAFNFEDDSDDTIDITYYSKCGDKNSPLIERSGCTNVEHGTTYEFQVNVTRKGCSQTGGSDKKLVKIFESLIGQDELLLEIDTQCNCDCNASNGELFCPPNSKSDCGICTCVEGWLGQNCNCRSSDGNALVITDSCRAPGKPSACSGLGNCICGRCECDEGFDGRFCECKACPLSSENNEVCGGSWRGRCYCGVCACHEDWSGPTCTCSRSKAKCMSPENPINSSIECSGHGTCKCGKCECSVIDGERYIGEFCETCTNCTDPACSKYEDCVVCMATNADGNECDQICGPEKGIQSVLNATDDIKLHNSSTPCFYLDSDNCKHEFLYSTENENSGTILIVYPKVCSIVFASFGKFNVFGYVVGITLLLGVIGIIIYKCIDNIRYKREYARFLGEVNKFKDDGNNAIKMNPLYRDPCTSFRVPDEYRKQMSSID